MRWLLPALLVAGGCAGELPAVRSPCDQGGSIERSGCDFGQQDARIDPAVLTRPPEGDRHEQAIWLDGYLRGRAAVRLQAERVSGRHMLYSGVTLFVLSAIGALVSVASLAIAGSDFCLGCLVTLVAAPMASVESAIGLPLLLEGIRREVTGERGLRALELIPREP